MKKICAVLLLLLTLLTAPLALTSCQSAEDVKGEKVTFATLEFNFFEPTLYGEKQLAEQGIPEGKISSYITGQKDGDKVVFVFCKDYATVDEAYAYLSQKALEYGEDYTVQKNGKTVFLSTEYGLKCATKKLYGNRLYHTFVEKDNYKYILEGIGNTIIITLGALAIGVILGVLVAVAKYYAEGNPKLKIINTVCDL